ncbi:tRNA lysidine(34) synthetase TilS [Pseudomonas sp. Pseusp122]|uniref:tRNA lysidine(34) synthetase TilS n=1 Tax=unclassified Pseudomonas TaxID=196821 RepID=UPI0039A4FA9F
MGKQPDPLALRLLNALTPWQSASTLYIAFSGGLDSTVLLHLLKTQCEIPIKAVHIHHGLQAAADAWPGHCQTVCDALGVPLQIIRVQVQPGASVERAAREARYGAFRSLLASGEVLLTAQHRDDQAETLLFRLLRGAGVRGLAAMPIHRPLGLGSLVRPLLDISRAELLAYAGRYQLSWIDDPSNADPHYARNYLRHQVMPAITGRWPQASASMARAAAHLSEAQELLDELAELDIDRARSESSWPWLPLPSLAMQPLVDLSDRRQRNLLRHWLRPLTQMPDSEHWAGWLSLRDAGQEGRPVWRLGDGELHRVGGRLWWLSGAWLRPVAGSLQWPDQQTALMLPGNGQVFIEGDQPAAALQVRYRQGGEIMALPTRGHRDLKRLLNEQGIPLFVRDRLPLLYEGERLIAVANLPGLDGRALGAWSFHWQPPTNDQGLS